MGSPLPLTNSAFSLAWEGAGGNGSPLWALICSEGVQSTGRLPTMGISAPWH